MGEEEPGREVTSETEACPKSPKSRKEKPTRPLLSYFPKWNRTQILAITLTTLTLTSIFSLGRFYLLLVPIQSDTVIWSHTYGGSGDDTATSLLQLADGGFAFCGSTTSWGLGGHWNGTGGGNDMWLVRLDENANLIWNRTYGTTQEDGASLLIECMDDGFALLGYTYVNRSGDYERVGLLVRTDANGNQLWNTTFDVSMFSPSDTMMQCNDGGFAIAGFAGDVWGGSGDFWLVRTDIDGNQIWNHTYSGYNGYQLALIEETGSGFLIFSRANRGSSSIYVENHDVFLLCTDATGNLLWSRTYDSGHHDYGVRIFPDNTGGYLLVCLAGYTPSRTNLWQIRISSTGDILWEHVTEPIVGSPFDILKCYDDGFIILGHYSPTQWWHHINLLLIRTDTLGNILWQREYGFDGVGDFGSSILQLGDGSFLIAAVTPLTPDVETSEAWLLRVTDTPISYYQMTQFMFYGAIITIITFIVMGAFIIAQRRWLRA
ncbi:MAG: hypothetical protein ACFFAL_09865 [Promethearchaeota archaeon]